MSMSGGASESVLSVRTQQSCPQRDQEERDHRGREAKGLPEIFYLCCVHDFLPSNRRNDKAIRG